MKSRVGQLWQSILGLPAWVKIWVMILATTNMVSFAFLNTETGFWAAIAFMIVGMFNMPMVFIQGGLTRLLSFPHLVWAALLIYLYPRLFGTHAIPRSDPEYLFALSIFIVNGISLMFDILECYRWLIGRREVLGLQEQQERASL